MSARREPTARTGILFICLGNICRSPMAEAVFTHLARERNLFHHFDIDSAGLGAWHCGERADRRTLEIARRRGIECPSIARQIDPAGDFPRFHWLIAMDRANISGLRRINAPAERIRLIREFDPAFADAPLPNMPARGEGLPIPPHVPDVPDPYSDDLAAFERMYDMLLPACEGLLDHVLKTGR